jgi:hypothetical protein
VSTRNQHQKRLSGTRAPDASLTQSASSRRDLAEDVARVAGAKRELLLRVHRHRLRREDLEDCFSQATLELIAHVRNGGVFADRSHTANALELRFLSRVRDRRRALNGRSPMQAALERATSLGPLEGAEIQIADARATVEALVALRDELRQISRLARRLTSDQRLALGSQLSGESRSSFCRRSGWSHEKYRKVGQRARAQLRRLMSLDAVGCPVERAGVGEEARTDL